MIFAALVNVFKRVKFYKKIKSQPPFPVYFRVTGSGSRFAVRRDDVVLRANKGCAKSDPIFSRRLYIAFGKVGHSARNRHDPSRVIMWQSSCHLIYRPENRCFTGFAVRNREGYGSKKKKKLNLSITFFYDEIEFFKWRANVKQIPVILITKLCKRLICILCIKKRKR